MNKLLFLLLALVPLVLVLATSVSYAQHTISSYDISIPNNPCIKQFNATPAMCERAKIINETAPTNMTAVIEKGIAQMFMKGEGHCLSK